MNNVSLHRYIIYTYILAPSAGRTHDLSLTKRML